jgi:hypothetical protein
MMKNMLIYLAMIADILPLTLEAFKNAKEAARPMKTEPNIPEEAPANKVQY